MSLRDWQRNSWLVLHKTSPDEISGLLAIVERDLCNAQVAGLADDWRLSIAYNAALQAATAALLRGGLSGCAGAASLSDDPEPRAHHRLAGAQGGSARSIPQEEERPRLRIRRGGLRARSAGDA